MKTWTTFALVWIAATSGLGCGGDRSSSGTSASTTVAGTTKPAPPEPDPNSPLTCAHDSDCPSLACGPCKSGQVVTRHYLVNCHHNPCPKTMSAVCRAGVCMVR
jgi:hypothetical protein